MSRVVSPGRSHYYQRESTPLAYKSALITETLQAYLCNIPAFTPISRSSTYQVDLLDVHLALMEESTTPSAYQYILQIDLTKWCMYAISGTKPDTDGAP